MFDQVSILIIIVSDMKRSVEFLPRHAGFAVEIRIARLVGIRHTRHHARAAS